MSAPVYPGGATESGETVGGRATTCALLIVGAVLIANFNALLADFVWDDRLLIVANSSIKNLDGLPALLSKPFLNVYYRPVVMLSFALEYAVYGLRPWGFHLTNVLLHATNAALVFLLLDRIVRFRRVALMAALLFAVHPANKAVITINDRTGLFAALFFLSSLILYLEHRRTEDGMRSALQYAASCVLFALGLFSKEEALTLPLMLVLVDSLKLGAGKSLSLAGRAARYLPFFLLTIFFFWVRGRVIDADAGIMEAFMTEPALRLMTVPSILVDYLLTLLAPININYDPRIPLATSIFQMRILVPILALAGVACAIPALVLKAKKEAFGALWYFVVFAPMCNIVPIYPDVAHVELTTPVRYLYLPSVGAFLVAALVFERLLGSAGKKRAGLDPRRAAVPAFCLLIFLFSLLSINRNTLWKDEALFYRSIIALQPDNHRIRFNLGTVYMQRKKLDAAAEQLGRAVTLAPDRAEYRNTLALVYEARGLPGRAVEELEHAVRLDPDSAMAHANLAATYRKLDRIAEAIVAGERAVDLAPSSLAARVNLGRAYAAAGEVSLAETHLNAAIELNPESAEAHYSLGAVYASTNRYSLARREWETALRIRPDMAGVRERLRELENMER